MKKNYIDVAEINRTYFPHQVEAINYGEKHSHFILGDDPGLGKTTEAIGIAMARRRLYKEKHCLVITCVNGLKYNWEAEIKELTDEDAYMLGTRRGKIKNSKEKYEDLQNLPDNYFLILNIEALRYKEGKGRGKYVLAAKIEELCKKGQIGLVIIDEIHKNKNVNAKQTRGLMKIKPKAAIAMTGTLILNKPLDAYVPLKWLGLINDNYMNFIKEYTIKGGWHDTEIIGYKNLDKLNRTINAGMLRRRKEDVLDLPEKIHNIEYVELNSAEKKFYQEILKSTIEEVKATKKKLKDAGKNTNQNTLAQWIRLRQVTGDANILYPEFSDSSKMQRLYELVEDYVDSGHKVIVFSEWTQITSRAFEKLKEFNPLLVTGDVELEKRQQVVDKFQTSDENKVMIGTSGALGTGFTLTKADVVIFLDNPWTKATKEQCEDRAHRIGTTNNVNIITLVCKNTIDEYIQNLIVAKGVLSDITVDPSKEKDGVEIMMEWLVEKYKAI